MDWTSIFRSIYFLGGINSLFFSILIIKKKNKGLADKILIAWLVSLAVQLIYTFFYLSDINVLQLYMGYEASLTATHPVFLYFYTKAMVHNLKFRWKEVVMLLPILAFLIVVPVFINSLPENRMDVFTELGIDNILGFSGIKIVIITFLLMGYTFVFFLASTFKELKRYRIEVLHIFSYRDNVDLLWLRRLAMFFTFSLLVTMLIGGVLYYLDISLIFNDFFFYMTLVVFVFLLAFWGYQQGTIFNINIDRILIDESDNSKKENQVINDYKKEAGLIEKIMKKEKPYLNPTLTIHDLSNLTNIPVHQLSKAINKSFGKNFFEYINGYRIKRFKESLKSVEYRDFTLLGIALECGFNSKSAFNRIFKEQTGVTPGDYKKSQLTK